MISCTGAGTRSLGSEPGRTGWPRAPRTNPRRAQAQAGAQRAAGARGRQAALDLELLPFLPRRRRPHSARSVQAPYLLPISVGDHLTPPNPHPGVMPLLFPSSRPDPGKSRDRRGARPSGCRELAAASARYFCRPGEGMYRVRSAKVLQRGPQALPALEVEGGWAVVAAQEIPTFLAAIAAVVVGGPAASPGLFLRLPTPFFCLVRLGGSQQSLDLLHTHTNGLCAHSELSVVP